LSRYNPTLSSTIIWRSEENEAILAIAKVRLRLRAPSITAEEYIASIEALRTPLTVKRLRSNASRI
jgi:hypothetical protein